MVVLPLVPVTPSMTMLCRMTEAVCRNPSQRDTGILHNDCGDALRRLLADNGCRALLHRLGDVLVAVGRVAADGYKQVARLYRAGVVTHFLDLDILCGSAVFSLLHPSKVPVIS